MYYFVFPINYMQIFYIVCTLIYQIITVCLMIMYQFLFFDFSLMTIKNQILFLSYFKTYVNG